MPDPLDPNLGVNEEDQALDDGLEEGAGTRPEEAEIREGLRNFPGSPTFRQLEEFYENAYGDPFQLAAKTHSLLGPGYYSRTIQGSTIHSYPSSTGSELIQREANRFIRSADQYLESRDKSDARLTLERRESLSGFLGRGQVSTYRQLLSGDRVRASFFQFQQREIVASTLNQPDIKVVTQSLNSFSSLYDRSNLAQQDEVIGSIFSGNELSVAAANRKRPGSILKLSAPGSFHPKVGYSVNANEFTAFIGSQNITTALSRNNTVETLLAFSSNPKRGSLGSKNIESQTATELRHLTDTIVKLAESDLSYQPGSLTKTLNANRVKRSFVKLESEISGEISSVISQAASRHDGRLVISMGEFSLLSGDSKLAAVINKDLLRLAQQGRLTLITDKKRLGSYLDKNDSGVIRKLMEAGAVKASLSGYHHDKSIAYFSDSGKLEYFSTGSANFSHQALTSLRDRYNAADLAQRKYLQDIPTLFGGDPSSPINAEANVAFRGSRFGGNADVDDFLGTLNDNNIISNFYKGLESTYNYVGDKFADPSKVTALRARLIEMGNTLGSSVQVRNRYTNKGQLAGLEVEVGDIRSTGHRATINLSIQASGEVVVGESGRLITGSILTNKSTNNINVLGKSIKSGGTSVLSAEDTAVALVGTLVREMTYQSNYGLVDNILETGLAQRGLYQDAGRDAIASMLRDVLPALETDNVERISLTSLLGGEVSGGYNLSGSIRQLELNLIQEGRNLGLTGEDLLERTTLLREVFNTLQDSSTPRLARAAVSGATLLKALGSDKKGLLRDIKQRVISQDRYMAKEYRRAAQTQSKRIVEQVTAPFLQAHELTYDAAQAASRLPVFSYTGTQGLGAVENYGVLDPAVVRAHTRLGDAGQFVRPVGAVTAAKPGLLPGQSGLRQLGVVDSGLSTGAAIAFVSDIAFTSTPGLQKVTREQYIKQQQVIAQSLGIQEPIDMGEILSSRFGEEQTMFSLPFPTPEQIPQRLKNLFGGRPALDLSMQFVKRALQLDPTLGSTNVEDALSGRIREALPELQLGKVKSYIEEFKRVEGREPTQAEITAYFRQQQANPSSSINGIIGTSQIRRYALNAGISLIGDYNYANDAFIQEVGSVSVMRMKARSASIGSQSEFNLAIKEIFSQGSVIFTNPQEVSRELYQEIITTLGGEDRVQQFSAKELEARLAANEFNNIYIQKAPEGIGIYRKEGLYSLIEGQYQRKGEFTSKGMLRILDDRTKLTSRTHIGERQEYMEVRASIFNRRYQNGLGVITSGPAIRTQADGTIVVESELVNRFEVSENMRVVGYGLAKGPLAYKDGSMFKRINQVLDDGGYLSKRVRKQKLYGLMGFSNFKGFSYQSGLALIHEADQRSRFMNTSGLDIAKSLSLLFSGSDIQAALEERLREEGDYKTARAVASMRGKDYSSGKDILVEGRVVGSKGGNLGVTASGLAMLGATSADIAEGKLSGVRDLTLAALRGDTSAQARLQTQAQKLYESAVSESVQLGGKVLAFNESSGISRGAGLLAHVTFMGQQLFRSTPSVGNLFERKYDDVDRYRDDAAHRLHVDSIALTMGIRLDPTNENELARKLRIIQSAIQNDKVIQNIGDLTVSQSLVPTGSKDEVVTEFQYLLGMSGAMYRAFSKIGLEQEDLSIQAVYRKIITGGRLAYSSNQSTGYRIGLLGDRDKGFIDSGFLESNRFALNYVTALEGSDLTRAAALGNKGALGQLGQIYSAMSTAVDGGADLSVERLALIADMGGYIPRARSGEGYTVGSAAAEFTGLYQQYRNAVPGINRFRTTFLDYARSNSGGVVDELERIGLLEDAVEVASQYEGRDTAEKVNLGIQQLLDSRAQSFESKVQSQRMKTYSQEMVDSIQAAARIQRSMGRGDDLYNTRQIILPSIATNYDAETGMHQVRMLSPDIAKPSMGVLMGADIIGRLPTLFPGHEDEAIRTQAAIRRELVESEDVLRKLSAGGVVNLTDFELDKLESFKQSLEQSSESFQKFASTDFSRKAFGDRQTSRGAVGIATTSFALDVGEVAMGDRFFNLTRDDRTLQAIDQQLALIQQSDAQSIHGDIQGLTKMIVGLGADQTSESFDQYRQLTEVISDDDATRLQYTHGQSTELRNAVIAAITNQSVDDIQPLLSTAEREISKRLSLGQVSVRRGGAPAGVSALINEMNRYTVMDRAQLSNRISESGGGILPSNKNQYRTALTTPAVGRASAMLGDYDGDAYVALLSAASQYTNDISHKQVEVFKNRQKVRRLKEQIQLREQAGRETSVEQVALGELEETTSNAQAQLNALIDKMHQSRLRVEPRQAENFSDIRQWSKAYLGLPDYLVDPQSKQALSDGELFSMSNFLRNTMPGLDDNSDVIAEAEQRINLMANLFSGDQFSFEGPESLDLDRVDEYAEYLQQFSSTSETELKTQIRDTLQGASTEGVKSGAAFEQFVIDFEMQAANMTSAFNTFNKSLGKADGTLANMKEMEALQAIIGKGGTELIGKSYNTIIPLLDEAIKDNALGQALQVSDFKENLKYKLALEGEAGIALFDKITSREYINQTNQRYAATTGYLGQLQQVIRDALKEKSEAGLFATLSSIDAEGGESLATRLDNLRGSSPEETDRMRAGMLRSILTERIGPNLEGTQMSSALNTQRHGFGLTGFGALITLADFSLTESNEEVYERFIAPNSQMEGAFEQALQTGQVTDATQFTAQYISGLLDRTRAAFLTQGKDHSGILGLYTERTLDYADSLGEPQSEFDSMRVQLAQEYRSLVAEGGEERELSRALVEESTFIEFQEQRSRLGMDGADEIMRLRESALITSSLRYGSGDLYSRLGEIREETLSSLTRTLRRNQLSTEDAVNLTGLTASTFASVLEDSGIDIDSLDSEEKMQVAMLAGLNPNVGLSKEEGQMLTQAMVSKNAEGQSLIGMLGQSSAAMGAMMGDMAELYGLKEEGVTPENERMRLLTERLEGLTDSSPLSLDTLQNVYRSQNTDGDPLLDGFSILSGKTVDEPSKVMTDSLQARVQNSVAGEIAGSVGVALLFGVAAKGVELDERAALLGYDIAQSVASMSIEGGTAINALSDESTLKAAQRFMGSRIRQQLQYQGLTSGLLSSVAQETISSSISRMAYNITDRVLGSRIKNMTSARSSVLAIGAETISTVMAQSLVRSVTLPETKYGGDTPDLVSRLVAQYTEQVWKSSEEAFLQLISMGDMEVIDIEENQAIDFEMTAVPSDLQDDIRSGLIVIDGDGGAVQPGDNLAALVS